MRVLLTEGAGFIGSHLVDKLLEEDYSVTALGNLSAGKLENVQYRKDGRGLPYAALRDAQAIDSLIADVGAVFTLLLVQASECALLTTEPIWTTI